LLIIIVTFKPPAHTHTYTVIFRDENGQDWNRD